MWSQECNFSDSDTEFDSHISKTKLAHMKIDVTRKPTQAKGKLASCAISIAMRHIQLGQNYYLTLKAAATERCQIQLATGQLNWYLIVLCLISWKGSFRKALNKNQQPRACRKSSKAYNKRKQCTSKRNKTGNNCISKWEPQVGERVMDKCQAVSDAVDGITEYLWWALERHSSDKTTYIRSCKEAGQNNQNFNQKEMKPYLPSMLKTPLQCRQRKNCHTWYPDCV
jgi:hypothetical protein